MYSSAVIVLTVVSFVLEAHSRSSIGSGTSSGRSRGRRIAGGAIAGIAIGALVLLFACLLCCCVVMSRRRSRSTMAAGPGAGVGPGAGTGPGYGGAGGGRFGQFGMFGKNRAGAGPPMGQSGMGPAAPPPAYAPGGQPAYGNV